MGVAACGGIHVRYWPGRDSSLPVQYGLGTRLSEDIYKVQTADPVRVCRAFLCWGTFVMGMDAVNGADYTCEEGLRSRLERGSFRYRKGVSDFEGVSRLFYPIFTRIRLVRRSLWMLSSTRRR